MKYLNKAILIALGMALPLVVMASPDDDVTIRMMGVNEHATEAITRQIELPEAADDRAKEHATKGMETANRNRNGEHNDMDRDDDRDHDMDDYDRDYDIEREEDHEYEMDMDRDDHMDVDYNEMDDETSSHDYK